MGTPVSTTNKTDHHDIAEILLKVALNTITLTSKENVSTHGNPNIDINEGDTSETNTNYM